MSAMKDLHLSYYEEAIDRGATEQDANTYADREVLKTAAEINNWIDRGLEDENNHGIG